MFLVRAFFTEARVTGRVPPKGMWVHRFPGHRAQIEALFDEMFPPKPPTAPAPAPPPRPDLDPEREP
ncbi:MAG: hypothetical protein CMJ18_15520 [Phycisphaeraceae bacterium]|nr:hypothetical protein [Phycisphaeraceae bacterium]